MVINSFPFFLMFVAVCLAPFVLIFQITRLAHSIFRNELWSIRDELTDDLRRGVIQRSEGAERLLATVQTHIDVAGRHALVDTVLAYLIYKSEPTVPIWDAIIGLSVPPGDRTKLNDYLQRLLGAIVRHLTWGSPTGWLAIPSLRLMWRLRRTVRRRKAAKGLVIASKEHSLRREAERVELEVMPKLMPSRAARRSGEASAILTELPC